MSVIDRMSLSQANDHVLLRRRNKRDIVALFEMFDQPQCRRGMVLDPFVSAEDVQAWFDSQPTGSFEMVATVADHPIGFAGLYPCSGSQSHSGWLSLFVHDAYHGRGIGTMMMRALLATADVLAALSRVQLIVQSDNWPAIALYRKFGFQTEGRHERFARRGEEFVAALTMARLTELKAVKPQSIEDIQRALREVLSQPDTGAVPMHV